MEGSIDVKLLLSLASVLVAIVTSSVIVKQKIMVIEERFNELRKDYESRLRKLDQRTDHQENMIDLNSQKTAVLSDILAPSRLEIQHREMERTVVLAESNQRRLMKLENMHNGKHPPVREH